VLLLVGRNYWNDRVEKEALMNDTPKHSSAFSFIVKYKTLGE